MRTIFQKIIAKGLIFKAIKANVLIKKSLINNLLSDIPSKHGIWLEAITSQDDLIALESATRGLEFALSDKSLSVKTLSKIIDETAYKTRPILVKLSQQFIRFEFMNSNLENNMLAVVYGFHKQLYDSYITLLNYFCSNPNQHTKNTVNLYMHGAVNQAFEMLKWRSFVNLGLAPNIWLQIHKILEVADKNQLLNDRLSTELITSEEVNSEVFSTSATLSSLLVQTYMLDSLQQANLSRQGVDIACKLLKQELLDVEISHEFNPIDYLFFVDLEKDFGAKRIRHLHPNNNLTDTCMYWQIDALETTIQNIMSELSHHSAAESGAESESLLTDLTIEPHQIKTAKETFSAILREWSRDHYVRQRRKETRRKVTVIANVLRGIEEVSERIKSQDNIQPNQNIKLNHSIKFSADNRFLEDKLRNQPLFKPTHNTLNHTSHHHHWVIVDESNRGLGAVASRELSHWIKVGKLVGLVLANSKQEMIIAVIKSIRPKENRQMQVGMEILSHHAKWVQMRPANQATDNLQSDDSESLDYQATSTSTSFTGLYLPIEAGLSLKSMLILPRIDFVSHMDYEISIAGMLDQVTLSESVDSRDDWVKIVYPR